MNTPHENCDGALWDLGDGRTMTTYDISRTPIVYEKSGTYTIRLTASLDGGCTDDYSVQVQVHGSQGYDVELNEAICQGETYTYQGKTYSSSGVYDICSPLEDGSWIRTKLTLQVLTKKTTDLSARICEGEIYTANNFHESKSGTYTQSFLTANGCDSVVTLNLSVDRPDTTLLTAKICEGSSYNGYGFSTSKAGTHTRYLRNCYGCDSTVILNLSVHPVYAFQENRTIVGDTSFTWHGQTISQGGAFFKRYTSSGGCDSTYTLQVRKRSEVIEEFDTLCTCPSTYTYQNQVFSLAPLQSGPFPMDYVLQYVDRQSCKQYKKFLHIVGDRHDTVYYELAPSEVYAFGTQNISAAGTYTEKLTSSRGCDSTVTLIATQPVTKIETTSADICAGESYSFHSKTYSRSGRYQDTTWLSSSQYYLTELQLRVHPTYQFTIDTLLAAGQTYQDANFRESKSGTFQKAMTTQFGCDSVYTLHLAVCNSKTKEISAAIAPGTVYQQYGFVEAASGTYTHHATTKEGCDSTTILHLTVLPQISPVEEKAVICTSTTYEWEGETYHQAGSYRKVFRLPDGRDSVRVLDLSMKPSYHDTIRAQICEGETYTSCGFTESTAGTYTQNLTSWCHCDSSLTLILTVYPKYEQTLYEYFCEGTTYCAHGISADEEGTYTRTYQAMAGCDSTIHVVLRRLPASPLTEEYDTIVAGQTYQWHGKTLSADTTVYDSLHNRAGCDSMFVLHLHVVPAGTVVVTFVDYDQTVLKRDTIAYGSDAALPADPEREGYKFVGWIGNYQKVTHDSTVTAQYRIYSAALIEIQKGSVCIRKRPRTTEITK